MMEIPIEVANKLWKDYPDALLAFKLWEQLHCDTGWDDKGNLILTPVSLSHHKARTGCPVSDVTPLIMNVVEPCDTELDDVDPQTEVDDRYDQMMASCLDRAVKMIRIVEHGESWSWFDRAPHIVSFAIVLFQAKVGQIVTVKKDSGPTGVQG